GFGGPGTGSYKKGPPTGFGVTCLNLKSQPAEKTSHFFGSPKLPVTELRMTMEVTPNFDQSGLDCLDPAFDEGPIHSQAVSFTQSSALALPKLGERWPPLLKIPRSAGILPAS